jgi:hypothetical protein
VLQKTPALASFCRKNQDSTEKSRFLAFFSASFCLHVSV